MSLSHFDSLECHLDCFQHVTQIDFELICEKCKSRCIICTWDQCGGEHIDAGLVQSPKIFGVGELGRTLID